MKSLLIDPRTLMEVFAATSLVSTAEIGTCAAAVSAVSIELKSSPVKFEIVTGAVVVDIRKTLSLITHRSCQLVCDAYPRLFPKDPTGAELITPPRRFRNRRTGLLEQREKLRRSLVGLFQNLHARLLKHCLLC